MAAKRREPSAQSRKAQQPQRPHTGRRKATLSIIGAGRLGTALALALTRRGYTVDAVVARTLRHARRAASRIQSSPLALAYKQLHQLPPSRLLFITTPDDAVASSALDLAASVSTGNRQRIALHTSGALSSTVLSPLREAGFHIGSMHPLVSVSDPQSGAESLQEAFYCVEGDPSAVRMARAIVRDLRGQSFSIDTEDKALYHAAAVMTSGHVVALMDMAIEMLVRCGLTSRRARSVLMPLLRSTLENLSAHDPARALTGTFARADTATVERHLAALRQLSTRETLAAYLLLGQRSIELARTGGANPLELERIALALEEASRDL